MLSGAAHAQSALNFARTTVNDRSDARLSVTNPSPHYADVQFTFYGLDGNPVSTGLGVNPVRYLVAPKGQVSMMASELFAGARADGWIQATSVTSGLLGFYTSGDVTSTLEGSEAASTFTSQLIPVVREDQGNRTELIVLNPGTANGNVIITIYNARGEEVGGATRTLNAHAALRLPVSSLLSAAASGNLSVSIAASTPVSATAIIEREGASLFSSGQPMDQSAAVRVAPHFVAGNGYDSVLFLANPTASPVSVTVTLFSERGPAVLGGSPGSPQAFTIPAHGSISADIRSFSSSFPFALTVNGWLRIDSPNIALNGLLVLDQGQGVTGVPLQTAPLERLLYSQMLETDNLSTGLALINSSATAAAVNVSVVDLEGTTFAQKALTIPPNTKYSAALSDIVPQASGKTGGYIFMRSTVPLWGFGVVTGRNGRDFIAAMPPASRVADTFAPNAPVAVPGITSIEPGTDVQTGTTLRISLANNLSGEPVFLIGSQVVAARAVAAGAPVYTLSVPAVEPGFVRLRVRSNGVESAPIALRVLPADNVPTQTVSGQAFYQKLDVNDAGLDLSHPVMFPIRNARVEVFDRGSQSLIAVSDTDFNGNFEVPVPMSANVIVRVVSRLRSSGESRVADNTNLSALYAVGLEFEARELVGVGKILLTDNTRISGAFNILEMVQRSNDVVRTADPNAALPDVTIFWSTRNSKRTVGTTYFNLSNNTAYVLGDRSDDADEYDDSIIIHEYAHVLAVRFSRDDSPGGNHSLGDILDPRVAWSEGWANFFACAVRNDSVFRDAGPNGLTLRYDLEDNIPAGDRPGYWSEASVQTLLWDLFDDHPDTEDSVQYPFSQIWGAFADLRNNRFVYLPYFVERFLARTPAATDTLRSMVQSRRIDFQPNVRPSVTNPFPRIVDVGETVTGFVDSLSLKRNNLMQSSHFMAFTTGGGNASIRLEIVGPGPADSPAGNDLDLFLLDANGRVLDRSDRGLNGQSELISVRLPAGTYVLEVRSYYTKAETGLVIFNSGDYRLSVLVQ